MFDDNLGCFDIWLQITHFVLNTKQFYVVLLFYLVAFIEMIPS